MLRSAVARLLARSGGFLVSLLDPSERASWVEPDAVIVSTPVELPHAVVIVVSQRTDSLEIRSGGRSRSVPYRGLAELTSLLLTELPA